jgi:hypothetical protein
MGHVEGLVSPARFAYTFPLDGEPTRDPDAFHDRMMAIAKTAAAERGWYLVEEPAHKRHVWMRAGADFLTLPSGDVPAVILHQCDREDATHLSVTWTWPPERVV